MTAPPVTGLDWEQMLADVVVDPTRLSLVFQPIVSLRDATIVGYEALSRFTGYPDITPDRWFAAARRIGCSVALESLVVERCLDLRDDLPPNCFLTLNISPDALVDPDLHELLLDRTDLSPLVIELTEQSAASSERLAAIRELLAARGALLALDDTGAGYSGLQQLSAIRPHMVKLDRSLVSHAERDEVKLALAELLGEFAGRIDAWLLAEGVETWGELEAFAGLGVPLAQGYLLGRPGPPWATLPPTVVERLLAANAAKQLIESVACLTETVPIVGERPVAPEEIALAVDNLARPTALHLPGRRRGDQGTMHRVSQVSLRVPLGASVVDVARRLVARPEHSRFDPVVCVDDAGRALGIVRVERVLMHLASLRAAQ